ncbi:putative riboflavin kinase [Podospora australis]|uniref:Riboflavin kinase n=1 Tax=Podospora australis TaxID=1536484 RepID=A0AAN7AGY5_9PEZI|nr:putative riboflavin kinase [Podospora australis]
MANQETPSIGPAEASPIASGTTRPLLIGPPSGPVDPYPLRMSGPVISGFGRGSRELGIPTANLPVDSSITPWISDIPSGVYFGWASLLLPPTHPQYKPSSLPSSPENSWSIFPMVMSIGYNPFYKNTVRSAEVHLLKKFSEDFYGCAMRLLIMGYIRDEKDYAGLEALIADINFDCEVAKRSLEREDWRVTQLGDGGKFENEATQWLVRGLEENEKKAVEAAREEQKRKEEEGVGETKL